MSTGTSGSAAEGTDRATARLPAEELPVGREIGCGSHAVTGAPSSTGR